MVKLKAYLQLIRAPILLLIASIQYAMRHFIIEPMLNINGFELQVSQMNFFWLVLSSLLIAAGGYCINDYFDVKIDRINKIKRVVVDRLIARRMAMILHMVLTGAGVFLAAFVSFKLGVWQLTSLFILVSFALWIYSTTLQHQLLIGNLVISILAGGVSLIVGLYEIPLQNAANKAMIQEMGFSVFNVPAYWIMGFSALIFLLTLGREITKDVVDVRGDKLYGSKTIPAIWGVKASKSVIITVYAFFGVLFSWFYFNYLSVHLGMSTVFSVVALALVLQIVLLVRARTKKHFSYSVNLNNLITILLILSTYLAKISIESYFA